MKALIVDDDYIAREWIRALLEEHPTVVIVGEAATGPDAVGAVEMLRPDVVFLDVGLPSMDGFEVMSCLGRDPRPLVILTTAFDRHALRAFDAQVLHYLLKPIERAPLAEALRRATAALESRRPEVAIHTRIAVRDEERVVLMKPSEIDMVSAAGNYVRIHRGKERFLNRQTMAAIEDQLRPFGFARIQRSLLINVERVKELQREADDTYSVVMTSGLRYRLSRHYRASLETALGIV